MQRSALLAALTIALLSLAATAADAPESTDVPTPVPQAAPEECLIERNHGACVECCKRLDLVRANFCARFCRTEIYPPPGGEPQP
jgi:hypothetical protein